MILDIVPDIGKQSINIDLEKKSQLLVLMSEKDIKKNLTLLQESMI